MSKEDDEFASMMGCLYVLILVAVAYGAFFGPRPPFDPDAPTFEPDFHEPPPQ